MTPLQAMGSIEEAETCTDGSEDGGEIKPAGIQRQKVIFRQQSKNDANRL